jgi:hypothetical protein
MPYGAPRIRAKKYTSMTPNKQGSIHSGLIHYCLLPSYTSIQTSASPLSSFFAAIDEIGIGLVPILFEKPVFA